MFHGELQSMFRDTHKGGDLRYDCTKSTKSLSLSTLLLENYFFYWKGIKSLEQNQIFKPQYL